ncbi:MAG: hypothetical protein HY017_05730 [Betaproteobacteria bacterium]|nr:hypothetical protein [Betaproteobacteria bacterium]
MARIAPGGSDARAIGVTANIARGRFGRASAATKNILTEPLSLKPVGAGPALLLRSIAEADRGETISGEKVLAKLARRHG